MNEYIINLTESDIVLVKMSTQDDYDSRLPKFGCSCQLERHTFWTAFESKFCSSPSATVSADEQSQAKDLILLKDNTGIEKEFY